MYKHLLFYVYTQWLHFTEMVTLNMQTGLLLLKLAS